MAQRKKNEEIVSALKQKTPLAWTVSDVSNWISGIGFPQYSKKFLSNKINGEELFLMTSRDLQSVGVRALGHQKSILRKIANVGATLTAEESNKSLASEGEYSSAGDDDNSSDVSSSASNSANRLELCVSMKDKPGVIIERVFIKKRYKLDRVIQKLEDTFDFAVEVWNKGVIVETEAAWNNIVASAVEKAQIQVKREDVNKIHKQERMMLQGLTDATAIIDTVGNVLFVNIAFEELTGYSLDEVLGMNVKMFTPEDIKVKHDGYLRRYAETGNARVIGSGRHVDVVQKEGAKLPCWLSVTEQKKSSGRHTYMGSLHQVESRGNDISSVFTSLDGVPLPCMSIDARGTIMFMNGMIEKLLGYKANELIGQNVACMMPEPYASNHSSFLRNYMKSGTPKVIGKGGRIVVAKAGNGSVLPVLLEVDEVLLGGKRFFVGVMKPKDKKKTKKKSLLDQTRSVMKSISVPAAIIDKVGTIQAFNAQAEKLFGFKESDVIGQNVKVLMPERQAIQHDGYLKNYRTTGIAKVIGSRRKVSGKKKNGDEFKMLLSISESKDPNDVNKAYYTGIMMPQSD